MADLAPGTLIAGYRIEAEAGRGGMGVVYRATQLTLDRPAALKLIAAELAHDEGFRRRFERESRIAGSIDHPNVIPVYEAGEADGALFLAMRWVEGTDLRRLLGAEGTLSPPRAVTILSQVAAALDAAHRHGLVHRDVKPANVLVTHDEDEHVYLTDFGLTRRTTSETALTQTGQFVGTIDYVAPEQIEGKPVDARADVYAAGCMLFHLLTGGVPYQRDSDVAKMFAHLNDPPPELPADLGVSSPGLDAAIRRSMAKDPSERQPSAGDLARAARAALSGAGPAGPERNVATGRALAGSVATEPSAPEDGPAAPATHGPPQRDPPKAPTTHHVPQDDPTAPVTHGAPAEPPSPARAPREGRERRGRPSPVVLAGALALVVVVVTGVVLLAGGGGDEGERPREHDR